ncbi:GNAT family N-acetyltransferase [Rhodopila sp.]|uniref:GNAT family N-acetyltransferase n=1 Tax=Rhodopila sp. TaxID=2480087 RepID=UPI003D148925
MNTAWRINAEHPAQPEVVDLLRDGEEHSASLYPAESIHHLTLDGLCSANVRFMVARDDRGRAVATGALVLHAAWAELKRMWVVADMRGRGVSKSVLRALVAEARRENVCTLRLETGVASHAALGLYANAGFARRGPFNGYRDDPLSVFMEMHLREPS